MGGGFALADFDYEWPAYSRRAERWGHEEAVRIARAQEQSGNGVCMVCTDGMVILTLEIGDNGEDQLFVVMAVSSGVPGSFKRHESEILAIAKDLNAKSVAFKSNRKGWARLLGKEWSLRGDEFSRSVP
jgi:hypothetical protein